MNETLAIGSPMFEVRRKKNPSGSMGGSST